MRPSLRHRSVSETISAILPAVLSLHIHTIQEPKAYKFTVGQGADQKTIRIIDTPGIGDSDGIAKDQENFRKILAYLSNYP